MTNNHTQIQHTTVQFRLVSLQGVEHSQAKIWGTCWSTTRVYSRSFPGSHETTKAEIICFIYLNVHHHRRKYLYKMAAVDRVRILVVGDSGEPLQLCRVDYFNFLFIIAPVDVDLKNVFGLIQAWLF